MTKDAWLDFPRIELGVWPTPLQHAAVLSEQLGRPLYIKREDMTGIGGGGNKIRKLEYQLGQALKEQSTYVMTTGAVQSNHAHLTAASAVKLGLKPLLVLSGDPGDELGGNLYLDRLLGAQVEFISHAEGRPSLETINEIMRQKAEQLKAQGEKVYIVPEGGSDVLGSVGYALAIKELESQLCETAPYLQRTLVVLATGTCGTHAGLTAGRKLFAANQIDIAGISISGNTQIKRDKTRQIANETLSLLGCEYKVQEDEILLLDEYMGEGYGKTTPECIEAISLAARTEGLFLDPVYTGKAFAALLDLAKRGGIDSYDAVVFMHNGGLPLLFRGEEEIAAYLFSKKGIREVNHEQQTE
jgi:D-cysteine desulfhydrase/L-cysteate sulfo-lyase